MDTNLTREACLCWLSSAGLTPDQQRELLEEEPDPRVIYDAFQARGQEAFPFELTGTVTRTLQRNAAPAMLNQWQDMMDDHSIRVMTILEEIYPSRLRPLPETPAILFYQGDPAAAERRTVSAVGSRNATYKGLDATRKISEQLSRAGIGIVSGLAYGVDAAAHQGCLKGGSPTIAVLGCGMDQDYPQENAKLRREILAQGGLILSEYTPGEKPLGWHFPWRNRIISGLGDCLMLLEARIRSGSMTTVQHALNQGKDIFVYPGEPGNPKCEGNHQLLREGAIYFTSAEDLMEDMNWLDKSGDVGQNNQSSGGLSGNVDVSPMEKRVLTQLDQGDQSFDQLCEALGMPAAQLNAALSMLQIQGLVQAMPGKIYARNRE